MLNEKEHLSVGASEKERFIPTSDRGKVNIGLASFLSAFDHSVFPLTPSPLFC